MANIAGVKANLPLVRQTYKNYLKMGEGATSDDFLMTFEGYPDLRFLVQSSQIPPLGREQVESYGPHGVKFMQYGRLKNSIEMSITFKEVITGKIYKALRQIVMEKKYLTITLALISESIPESQTAVSWVIEDALIDMEGADLSVEDNSLLKPSGTIYGTVWPDEQPLSGLTGTVSEVAGEALSDLIS